MRLNTTSQSNRYLARKEQFHLLMLVVLLGFVIIAMKKSSEPEFWAWMFPEQKAEEETSSAETKPSDQSKRPIVTIAQNPTDRKASDTGQPESFDLSVIKDNSVGVRHDESPVYFSLLKKVSSMSDEELQKDSLQVVSYAILNEHPDDYRGKLIELKGDLRRLTQLPFAGEEGDLTPYYEAWIFTEDSGVEPYRVICTQPDKSFPLKHAYTTPIPVEVTGYFFKKQAYAAQKGLTVAPLILAGKLTEREVSETKKREPVSRIQQPILWFVSIFTVVFLLAVWRYQRSDSRSRIRMQRGKYLGQKLKIPEITESSVEDEEDDEETD